LLSFPRALPRLGFIPSLQGATHYGKTPELAIPMIFDAALTTIPLE
jgi:hypothetical protein